MVAVTIIVVVVAGCMLPRLPQANDDRTVLAGTVEDPEPGHKASEDAKVLVSCAFVGLTNVNDLCEVVLCCVVLCRVSLSVCVICLLLLLLLLLSFKCKYCKPLAYCFHYISLYQLIIFISSLYF